MVETASVRGPTRFQAMSGAAPSKPALASGSGSELLARGVIEAANVGW